MFVIVALVCLLVGVSGGAAMAEGCGDGVLQNETFDGDLIIFGEESCTIIGSTIGGNLSVRGVGNVLLLNNKVGGNIRVRDNGVANVIANTVFEGPIGLVVKNNNTANVIENETLTGSIRVTFNVTALVQKNIAVQNLICRENASLDSFINFAGNRLNCE
jgi:hypothetical protein